MKFFNSHIRVPSTSGPTLMDTQFGSKKHFTRQLPSFGTISVLITWPGRTLSFIGSLKMMTRLYSVTKTARNNECEKKSVSICYVPPLCSFIHQHISEEIHGFYMTSPKFKLRNNFSWVSTFMRSYNSLIFVFLQICSSKLTNERVLIRFEIEDA